MSDRYSSIKNDAWRGLAEGRFLAAYSSIKNDACCGLAEGRFLAPCFNYVGMKEEGSETVVLKREQVSHQGCHYATQSCIQLQKAMPMQHQFFIIIIFFNFFTGILARYTQAAGYSQN